MSRNKPSVWIVGASPNFVGMPPCPLTPPVETPLALLRYFTWDIPAVESSAIFTESRGKRNATVWCLSVCLSVPSAYSPWLTRGQHATRPAYIMARQYGGLTYLFINWYRPRAVTPWSWEGNRGLVMASNGNLLVGLWLTSPLFLDVCIEIVTVKQSAFSLFAFMCVYLYVCSCLYFTMCVFLFFSGVWFIVMFSLLHVRLLRALIKINNQSINNVCLWNRRSVSADHGVIAYRSLLKRLKKARSYRQL